MYVASTWVKQLISLMWQRKSGTLNNNIQTFLWLLKGFLVDDEEVWTCDLSISEIIVITLSIKA